MIGPTKGVHMNFILENNTNGDVSLLHVSCGGGPSCATQGPEAKRAADKLDKTSNDQSLSCS